MKYIFIITLSLIHLTSTAQIEMKKPVDRKVIGTVKQSGRFVADLAYYLNDNDTTYSIMYINKAYNYITDAESIMFSSENNTLSKLYEVLKTVFSKENEKNKDYKLQFSLGTTDVTVSNYRALGQTWAQIYTRTGFFYLSEKQLETLFGKKD